MNNILSKKQIFILVFVLATAAALYGVFYDGGEDKISSIEWNEDQITTETGEVLLTAEEVPSSMQVSSNSEFGVAGPFQEVSLSPDKEWIAFAMTGVAHGAGWIYEIDSENIYPAAFQYGGGVEIIEWSPDSQYIAFNIGTPAPTEYIKVVNRDNIAEYVSETGEQLRLDGEAGLTPPFSYEFVEWQAPHTICYSLNDDEDCLDMSSVDNESEDTSSINLESETIAFESGEEVEFRIDESFDISVAEEGLGKARFISESPDGRFFVPDMVDYELSHEGEIFILDDFNEDTHEFESRTTYLSDLRGPHDVSFYTDSEGNDWIYITLTEHLIRYPYNEGDTSPPSDPEVVYEFPNEVSPNADGGVWHLTRSILFDDDRMFISVGSGCNACEEVEGDLRPVVLTMTPEGDDVEVYAEGIKNAVGLGLVDGQLYATENGPDHLGIDAPNDTFYKVEEGEHYGWPYCYELSGRIYKDDSVENSDSFSCEDVPLSFASFQAHSAPLGFNYFEDFNSPVLEDSFLVAMQGSWEKEIGTGYKLNRVTEEGKVNTFMDGFLDENGDRVGRPVDVFQKDENSFFVTDDFNGKMYYIYN